MNMQATKATSPKWVTVSAAAIALTKLGDKIDASNVSRYLARHKDSIPTERRGKFRLVDLDALASHRKTSVFVADKQSSRGVDVTPVVDLPLAQPRKSAPTEDDEDASLGQINRALKALELRRRQREEDEADGKLVPDHEVLTLIAATVQTLTGSLERQEASIAQIYGREVAAQFRKARKAALADASRRLVDLAKRHLPAAIAPRAVDAATAQDEQMPETATG